MTTREPREASRRDGRDSHGRRPHSSFRSRRDDPSPRRRDDRRRESDRAHHRSRDGEFLEVVDHDQKRNRDAAQSADPPNAESKSASDLKNGPSTRHERSPRGTKRFSESSEAWRPRSFFQHNERGSAGQGGRHYDRQASDYGRQREHLSDRDKQKTERHSLQGKIELDQQKKDVDSTWKHDGFFQLEEAAPLAKKRPPFQEMKIQESADTVTEPDSRSRNYQARGYGNHRPFLRPDDRGFRRGFPDHRSDGQRNGHDIRGRFSVRGGMDRDRFNNPYGGRSNAEQASGDQEEKWKHDLYDQTNRSPPPKTEEEQIAKVEALLAL
uniref:Somatic embryogenesis related protein n=1 Tax=Zea mays TaxID=4577 RepID=B6TIS5_MAIZE|nr:somatic embryogenesis related protein [Zea mays]|eukprot:NP_001149854.1 somatic embryogenesis related protein [Zea mays]